jgi:hypothetical protein
MIRQKTSHWSLQSHVDSLALNSFVFLVTFDTEIFALRVLFAHFLNHFSYLGFEFLTAVVMNSSVFGYNAV